VNAVDTEFRGDGEVIGVDILIVFAQVRIFNMKSRPMIGQLSFVEIKCKFFQKKKKYRGYIRYDVDGNTLPGIALRSESCAQLVTIARPIIVSGLMTMNNNELHPVLLCKTSFTHEL
jgi:hypothetical protein